jgi:Tol biopolymer transport system component
VEGQNVWRVDLDGANLKQLTHDRISWYLACSPDGKWVYFRNQKPPMAIERVSIEGGTPELITESVIPTMTNQISFSLSPDGKRLAFAGTRTDTHRKQIVLVNLDESKAEATSPLVLDADPRMSDHPEFTPDGLAVVYGFETDGIENLWLQPLNGRPGHQITHFPDDVFSTYLYSSDGKTLAMLRYHTYADVVLLHDTTDTAQ